MALRLGILHPEVITTAIGHGPCATELRHVDAEAAYPDTDQLSLKGILKL